MYKKAGQTSQKKDESNDEEETARNLSIANLRQKAEAHSKNLHSAENELNSEDEKIDNDDARSSWDVLNWNEFSFFL